MTVRQVVVAMVVWGLCGLSGCADGTSDPPPAVPDAQPALAPELEGAVRAYNAAFFGGDVDAVFAARSVRCRMVEPLDALRTTVVRASEAWPGVAMVSYEEAFEGEIGRPTYEMADPTLNQRRERWIVEDGAWRNDDCPGVAQQ